MINVVFAKMDTYVRYGQQESIDVRKLVQGSGAGNNSARSGSQQLFQSSSSQILDQKLMTKSTESKTEVIESSNTSKDMTDDLHS